MLKEENKMKSWRIGLLEEEVLVLRLLKELAIGIREHVLVMSFCGKKLKVLLGVLDTILKGNTIAPWFNWIPSFEYANLFPLICTYNFC